VFQCGFSKKLNFEVDLNNNVLYRKYRPQKFNQVIGQEVNVKILKNIIAKSESVHAMIFCGTRGTGKTTLAKIFAKALLCEKFSQNLDVCGNCKYCQNIEGSNYSIVEIDAASNNGVDEVRNIRDGIELSTESGKKIYIIDEVHMFTKSAFNALLKTIEEPPANVYFILATTEFDKIPETIASRCLKLDFNLTEEQTMYEYFETIIAQEDFKVDNEALKLVIENSNGSIRDGLSVLEKLKIFATNDDLIDINEASKVLGTIPTTQIIKLLNQINKREVEESNNLLSEISTRSLDYKTFIEQLIIQLDKIPELLSVQKSILEIYLSIDKISNQNVVFIMIKAVINDHMNSFLVNEKIQPIKKELVLSNIDEPTQLPKIEQTVQSKIIHLDIEDILSEATKNDKLVAINKINKFKQVEDDIKYTHVINAIQNKLIVVASSSNGIIFETTSESIITFLTENKNDVDRLLSKVYNHKLAYHICKSSDWQEIRKNFIEKNKLKKQIARTRQQLMEDFNEK
jgi:DNA polymerase III subunit gamma/tau